jgi:putative PIN family toxin of toxin-antitoxin system
MEVCLSEHEIVLCDDLLEEVLRNLRLKIKFFTKLIDYSGDLLLEQASLIDPVPLSPDICRDPDDVKILGLAVAADANYIVSGDKDLLILKGFQGIQILNPRGFSKLLHCKEE